ncbi:MAG: hypothetical protein H0V49_09550 [Nocardioidaceae bacterium]|nr:hypothetical protein [Nocardioidaceae bacterium]
MYVQQPASHQRRDGQITAALGEVGLDLLASDPEPARILAVDEGDTVTWYAFK